MKKLPKVLLTSALCLTSIIPMFGCSSASADASAYVTVDINPSIEFLCDDNGRVVVATALNDDGRIMISDIDFKGQDIEIAVKRLTKEAEELGYITDENKDVSIDVSADNQAIFEKIEQKAKKGAKEGCDKIVLQLDQKAQEILDEVASLKEENPELYRDLTPAILKMVKRIAEYDRDFTVEIAMSMSHEELVDLLHEYIDEHKDFITKEVKIKFDEQFMLISDTILKQIDALYGEVYQAKNAMLRQLELLEDKFEEMLKDPEGHDFDDDNALLTQAMKDQLTLIIGENTITDLDGLDEYIDALEDEVEEIVENTNLNAVQQEIIETLKAQFEEMKNTAMKGIQTHIDQAKEHFRQQKHDLKHGPRA